MFAQDALEKPTDEAVSLTEIESAQGRQRFILIFFDCFTSGEEDVVAWSGNELHSEGILIH